MNTPLRLLAIALIGLLATLARAGNETLPATPATATSASVVLDVYKSRTCYCCNDWMDHLGENGFVTRSHHPDDLDALKAQHGIPAKLQSCHTGVSAGGYVFEGHVPARYIRQFLANPPAKARGLVVPGMPIGSPGMERGKMFEPYEILLLKDDGSTEVYATVSTQADQRDADDAP